MWRGLYKDAAGAAVYNLYGLTGLREWLGQIKVLEVLKVRRTPNVVRTDNLYGL